MNSPIINGGSKKVSQTVWTNSYVSFHHTKKMFSLPQLALGKVLKIGQIQDGRPQAMKIRKALLIWI